jgi:hypothetical protein
MALELARVLLAASEDVSTLGFGEASAMSMSAGRSGDQMMATREWIGPHRDTFDQLMENELDSARTTRLRLESEADAWSQFWARATNARNDRLHDEAMTAFRSSMERYDDQMESYNDAIESDDTSAGYYRPPIPPTSPTRAPYVSAPTAATNYWPS